MHKLVKELYRENATIGDGGTASALIYEVYSGGKPKHLLKARERMINLNGIIKTKNLSLNDLDIAEALREDLENALELFE